MRRRAQASLESNGSHFEHAIASVLSCYVRGKTEEINKHSFLTPMRFDVIISPTIAGKLRTVVTPEASVSDPMFMGHFLLV